MCALGIPDVSSRDPKLSPDVDAPEKIRTEKILSVGQLGRMVRVELERATSALSVEGEVASLRQMDSGHAYFTLRDEREDAAIDCVMYRSAAVRARRLVAEGARLVLGGRVTFWAPRGRVQLVVDTARLAGKGALLEALARRREALAAEGLFAIDRKRPLPHDPRCIGIVTSGQGAALHDILKVAFQRGSVKFVLDTAPVQGAGAAEAMARSLRRLCKHPEVETIVLARGGGSNDDLAAFNEEVLVRAVAACAVPVVSAVGHEIDVSLVDLAADVRAATPSQAAELLVPDARARRELLSHLRARLARGARRGLDERQQSVDVARSELEALMLRALGARRDRVTRLDRRLASRHPVAVLSAARASLAPLEQRMVHAMRRSLSVRRGALVDPRHLESLAQARVNKERARLGELFASLDALSPLAVLGRGYALVQRDRDSAIVRRSSDVRPGDALRVRVGDGSFSAVVEASASEPLASTEGASVDPDPT